MKQTSGIDPDRAIEIGRDREAVLQRGRGNGGRRAGTAMRTIFVVRIAPIDGGRRFWLSIRCNGTIVVLDAVLARVGTCRRSDTTTAYGLEVSSGCRVCV